MYWKQWGYLSKLCITKCRGQLSAAGWLVSLSILAQRCVYTIDRIRHANLVHRVWTWFG